MYTSASALWGIHCINCIVDIILFLLRYYLSNVYTQHLLTDKVYKSKNAIINTNY